MGPTRGGGLPLAGLLGLVLLACAAAPCWASDFTRSFANITQGSGILLIWEEIDPKYVPLAVYAQVVNRTGDNKANVFKRNITVGIKGTSFLWENIPSPLPYLATGLYQVEVKPESLVPSSVGPSEGSNLTAQQPVIFPKSPYFLILDGKTIQTSGAPGDSSSSGGAPQPMINRTVSTIVGVVVGLAILGIAGVIGFFWRRRVLRRREEERKRSKFDIVIH